MRPCTETSTVPLSNQSISNLFKTFSVGFESIKFWILPRQWKLLLVLIISFSRLAHCTYICWLKRIEKGFLVTTSRRIHWWSTRPFPASGYPRMWGCTGDLQRLKYILRTHSRSSEWFTCVEFHLLWIAKALNLRNTHDSLSYGVLVASLMSGWEKQEGRSLI